MQKYVMEWDEVRSRALDVAENIRDVCASGHTQVLAYPIPAGGIFAAQAVAIEMATLKCCYGYNSPMSLKLVENISHADVIIDDIVDTGRTKAKVLKRANHNSFWALVDKSHEHKNRWVVFPWETMQQNDHPATVEDNIVRILQSIGEDPTRNGLIDTPKRVVASYETLFSGYNKDASECLKTFDGVPCDQMILLNNIEFYSTCEHHMLPFYGTASIAYIPKGDRVVGISKLSRVLEVYSRRLQVQERLTSDVTKCIQEALKPEGVACVLKAKHLCMMCRGVEKQGSEMVTSSLTGVFRKPEVRAEFFSMTH